MLAIQNFDTFIEAIGIAWKGMLAIFIAITIIYLIILLISSLSKVDTEE
jgi:hypothetical protein